MPNSRPLVRSMGAAGLLLALLLACNNSATTVKLGGVEPGTDQPPVVSSEPKGKWGAVLEFPIVPISAALMPNGKVVTWSSWDRFAFSGDTAQRNKTFTATFDPNDDSVSERLVTETTHDMFCPGTALLSDGRLLVNGGGPYISTTSVYSSANNSWTNTVNMNRKRWYNSSTTLPDGSVFTLGGVNNSGGDPKTIVEAGERC